MTERRERPEPHRFEEDNQEPGDCKHCGAGYQVAHHIGSDEHQQRCPHGIGTDDECSRCLSQQREVHFP